MAGSSLGRSLLIGVALGVGIGTIVGLIGAALDWPMAVRGGIIGALVVVGFTVLHRSSAAGKSQP